MDVEWPLVDLIVITFDRISEIQSTIAALEEKLDYPRTRLRYLICDDATPGDYRSRLSNTHVFKKLHNIEFVPTPQGNLGWGASVNRALRYSSSPYIFQIEDDYILQRPLNLRAAVAAMEVKAEIGMMRFRGTAGDHMVFHQMEADISVWMPDYRDGVGVAGKLCYFLIDSGSPGLYIYSHGAHLKRNTFHSFYGNYPVGLKLGHTEESMAHQVKDMMRTNVFAPVITIQPEWIPMFFDHIGVSYQHTALDVAKE